MISNNTKRKFAQYCIQLEEIEYTAEEVDLLICGFLDALVVFSLATIEDCDELYLMTGEALLEELSND